MAFLDSTGLAQLWEKIVAKINSSAPSVTVDAEISETSANAVQNKAVYAAIDAAKSEVLQLANEYTDHKIGQIPAVTNEEINTICK